MNSYVGGQLGRLLSEGALDTLGRCVTFPSDGTLRSESCLHAMVENGFLSEGESCVQAGSIKTCTEGF